MPGNVTFTVLHASEQLITSACPHWAWSFRLATVSGEQVGYGDLTPTWGCCSISVGLRGSEPSQRSHLNCHAERAVDDSLLRPLINKPSAFPAQLLTKNIVGTVINLTADRCEDLLRGPYGWRRHMLPADSTAACVCVCACMCVCVSMHVRVPV